jgi:hypothetical protein
MHFPSSPLSGQSGAIGPKQLSGKSSDLLITRAFIGTDV